jgi:hypothetical protein
MTPSISFGAADVIEVVAGRHRAGAAHHDRPNEVLDAIKQVRFGL